MTSFSASDDCRENRDEWRADEFCPIPMKRWFPDALSPRDTPLTLAAEWLVGEIVDATNCAGAITADEKDKVYLPMTSGHLSEWVLGIIKIVSDASRASSTDADAAPSQQMLETVASRHSFRLPDPADVERASRGEMTRERAVYSEPTRFLTGERRDDVEFARSAMDFAPRPAAIGCSLSDDGSADPVELAVLRFFSIAFEREEKESSRFPLITAVRDHTWKWFVTLANHYARATEMRKEKSRPIVVDESDSLSRAPESTRLAIEIAAASLGSLELVSECVRGCFDRAVFSTASRRDARSSCATWNARVVGYPFKAWSMLSQIPIELATAYQELISRARGRGCERAIPSYGCTRFERAAIFSDNTSRDVLSISFCRRVVERPPVARPTSNGGGGGDDDDEDEECRSPSEAEDDRTGRQVQWRRRRIAAEEDGGGGGAAATEESSRVAVQRFEERLDIPGMRDLISSCWACTPSNVDTVASVPFRSFVLEVKREVRNAPKASRGRAMLPTHEFIQSIVKAVDGKVHMYGSISPAPVTGSQCPTDSASSDRHWIDDYHPTTNPKGCPPWVLVAVVMASCLDGMRHVMTNVSDLRTQLERLATADSVASAVPQSQPPSSLSNGGRRTGERRRGKPPKILSIGGIDICFPQTFLGSVSKIVRGETKLGDENTAKCATTEKDEEQTEDADASATIAAARCSAGCGGRKWSELGRDERDDVVTRHFLTWFKGFVTFGRFARKCASIPTWLATYVCAVGDMFESVDPDVDAIRKFLKKTPKMSDWLRRHEMPDSKSRHSMSLDEGSRECGRKSSKGECSGDEPASSSDDSKRPSVGEEEPTKKNTKKKNNKKKKKKSKSHATMAADKEKKMAASSSSDSDDLRRRRTRDDDAESSSSEHRKRNKKKTRKDAKSCRRISVREEDEDDGECDGSRHRHRHRRTKIAVEPETEKTENKTERHKKNREKRRSPGSDPNGDANKQKKSEERRSSARPPSTRRRRHETDALVAEPLAKRSKTSEEVCEKKQVEGPAPTSLPICCSTNANPTESVPPLLPYARAELLTSLIEWTKRGTIAEDLRAALVGRGVRLDGLRTIVAEPVLIETVNDESLKSAMREIAERQGSDDDVVMIRRQNEGETPASCVQPTTAECV